MNVNEDLKTDLRKIIGGTVESAFELKAGRGIFMTIRAEGRTMALVVEESGNGYGDSQRTTEVYVMESLV